MPTKFPSFELQASRDSLVALGSELTGFAVERIGKSARGVWLRNNSGQVWLVAVDQRDLQFKFEVFTLGIDTIQAVNERWANWQPHSLPEDIPEYLRQLLTTRAPAPIPPTDFNPWPFGTWRTDVLRRAEFIIEDVDVGPTIGNNPNMQDASRLGSVPPEASASCEVAVGILFSDQGGQRLLMGVDWMPMNMIVTESAAEIDEYIAPCEVLGLATYLERLHPAA